MAFYMGLEYEPAAQRQYRVGDRVRHKIVHEAGDGIVQGVEDEDYCFIKYENYGCATDPSYDIAPVFVPGDRVKLNKHSGLSACGDCGTVRMVADNNNVSVRMDDSTAIGTFIAAFHADDLDWVRDEDSTKRNADTATPQAAAPCIVALSKDGQPFPAGRPHLHPSAEAATEEAERLARNNPGAEFAVYQRVTGRVAKQHVEMKEVA